MRAQGFSNNNYMQAICTPNWYVIQEEMLAGISNSWVSFGVPKTLISNHRQLSTKTIDNNKIN